MSLSRKLIVHVLLALMLFVGVSSAAAAPAADHQVVTGTVSFTIPADQCPELPAGVSVSGYGRAPDDYQYPHEGGWNHRDSHQRLDQGRCHR